MLEAWRIELLGGLTVRNSETKITRFRTQQTGLLLAYLALTSPHRAHSRDDLASLLWEDDDPEAARAKLRIALSSLRRQLESPTKSAIGSVIEADRASVRLREGSFLLDVHEFDRAFEASHHTTSPAAQLQKVERTTSLYCGELLPGFHASWVIGERERLKRRFGTLLLRASMICETQGDLEGAIQYSERATQEDPLSETPCSRLMELLLRSGQASAAMRQYQALENRLREILGVAPSPELKNLLLSPSGATSAKPFSSSQSQLRPESKSEDSHAIPSLLYTSSSFAVPFPLPFPLGEEGKERVPPLCRLPLQTTRFFGRVSEIETLTSWLLSTLQGEAGASPILTITGMGGFGKTRMAIEVAQRLHRLYGVGVCFVGLAEASTAEEIPSAIARSLSLPASEEEPLKRVRAALGDTPTLLILDNCEQIAENQGGVITRLMETLPSVRYLITSRQSLGLTGERLYPLTPLPFPEGAGEIEELAAFSSVRLFIDRAQAIRPDFQMGNKNAESISALCRKLEGMPLAIELAAAWVGTLTSAQMLSKLEERFDSLASRKRDSIPRHKSLHAAIDWSYRLLTPSQQRLFCGLSVFRGGFTGEVVQQIFETEPFGEEITETLTQLCEQSLVVSELEESGETMRYRLLESLREFGEEQLSEPDQKDLSRRHALCFLRYAERAREFLEGAEGAFWYRQMERERANFGAALDFLERSPEETEVHLRFTDRLHLFWYTRGYFQEGRERLASALGRPDVMEFPQALSGTLRSAQILARIQGDLESSEVYGLRSLELARQIGDKLAASKVLGGLGNTAKSRGDYVSARRYYAECLELADSLKNKLIRATMIGNLANVEKDTGHPEKAKYLYEESLALNRELGNAVGETIQLTNIAALLNEVGKPEEGMKVGVECLRLCRKIGDKVGIAYILEILAVILATLGKSQQSLKLFAAGEQAREEIGLALELVEVGARVSLMETIREQMGEEIYVREWKEAQTEGIEQQIECFLQTWNKETAKEGAT